mmetsp:Transcript_20384/g.52195  ORF Transcript_20384/g.52195 Transcript_20384/m.52195 type:complete len:231 (+) Transcript_20384:1315-2007(+)
MWKRGNGGGETRASCAFFPFFSLTPFVFLPLSSFAMSSLSCFLPISSLPSAVSHYCTAAQPVPTLLALLCPLVYVALWRPLFYKLSSAVLQVLMPQAHPVRADAPPSPLHRTVLRGGRPVHCPLHYLAALLALPPVLAVVLHLVVKGVVYCDVVASWRAEDIKYFSAVDLLHFCAKNRTVIIVIAIMACYKLSSSMPRTGMDKVEVVEEAEAEEEAAHCSEDMYIVGEAE